MEVQNATRTPVAERLKCYRMLTRQGWPCRGRRCIGSPWRLVGVAVRLPPSSPIGDTPRNPAVRRGPSQAPRKLDGGTIQPLFRRSRPAFRRRWTGERARLSDKFCRRHMHAQGLLSIVEAEGRRQVELKDWLGLLTPATVVGAANFMWRVLARLEDRAKTNLARTVERITTANTESAQAAIGEGIGALDNKIDGMESRLDQKINAVDNKVSAIKDKLAETREDVAPLKAHIVAPRSKAPPK